MAIQRTRVAAYFVPAFTVFKFAVPPLHPPVRQTVRMLLLLIFTHRCSFYPAGRQEFLERRRHLQGLLGNVGTVAENKIK